MTRTKVTRAPRVRGASFVQYLVVVALALGALLTGAKVLGASVGQKSGALATCVKSLDGTCGGEGSSLGSGASNAGTATTASNAGPSDPQAEPAGQSQSANPSAAVVPDPGSPFDAADAPSYGPPKQPAPENYDGKKEVPVRGTLFVKGEGDANAVSPADIGQGQLGDCFLMSSLAAVALRAPGVIQSNMRPAGKDAYQVRIFDDVGKSHWQKVDARYPIDKQGEIAYARPMEGNKQVGAELWVMTYERAMAKSAGGYGKIDGGDPGAAMAMITGQPSAYMKTAKTSFGTFAAYFEHGYAMAAGTPEKSSNPLFKNDTLVNGHAYWVEKVDAHAQTVTVRNPWGYNLKPVTLPWKTFQETFPDAMANPIYDRNKKS